MSGRDDDPDDTPSEFQRAPHGAKPIDRSRLRPEPPPRLPRTPAAASADPSGGTVELLVEQVGEQVEGRAPDTDPALLARLRGGEPPPERRLDLHGHDAASAERALRRELASALEAGLRCVLVVHGRGLRSEGGAVLKPAFPEWLARPPHGARVLAFCSARPEHGGTGASYVLLRRKR